jgi:hypothetical protein
MHLNPIMAKDNREYKPADPGPGRKPEQSKYGDHPLLGNDTEELLHFPQPPAADPMTHLPSDPARDAWRKEFETKPHDPSVDFQPPNPMLVVPPANATMRLLGAVAALLLFAIVLGLLFYRWMTPLPRHPGEKGQSPGLVQKIP